MSAQLELAGRPDKVPATLPEPTDIMGAIIKAASDPNTDVTKLERMMAMYERLESRKAEQLFNEAMNEAQTAIRPIAADASNSQTKSKYATYAALDRALRPIYTKTGFSLSFDNGDGAPADHIRVLCYVAHKDGFTRTYKTDMPADGKGAKGGDVMTKTHAAGSAMTYGQRYLLKMIFNIAIGDRDDDGNDADDIGDLIGDEDIAKIFDLIKRSSSDTAKFCKYMKVESVPDIRKRDVGRALEALNSAMDAKAKKDSAK